MDTSNEYIEMCKQAIEVHVQHEAYNGGPLPNLFTYNCAGNSIAAFHYARTTKFVDDVWLPRQDQLQHMATGLEGTIYVDMKDNQYCIKEDKENHIRYFSSFEQMWLNCVMMRNHSKEWDAKFKTWRLTTQEFTMDVTEQIKKYDLDCRP